MRDASGPRRCTGTPVAVFYLKLTLTTVAVLLLWAGLLVAGALFGWWRQPLAPPGDARDFMAAAVALIEERHRGSAALVLIEDGEVFAEHYASVGEPVDATTVFPVASMSKWVTAVGVMALVEQGRLDLDRPVDDYLSRWRFPDSGFDDSAVTARRLLSHTAGLTDGLGFADYRADEPLPTLLESLQAARASSGSMVPIVVARPPGSGWRYSGGGYLVLELLVEDVSGQRFDAFMADTVFRPLGMSGATYQYLGDVAAAAVSYSPSGRPVPHFRYASRGATALGASAADLTRLVRSLLGVAEERVLRPETVAAMRAPEARALGQDLWGLGTMLYAPTDGGDVVFGHDGGNEPAINAAVRINPDTADAVVALVTGNTRLASLVGFHWVFWQTGLPDVFSVGQEVRGVMTLILVGWSFMLAIAVVVAVRRRRR